MYANLIDLGINTLVTVIFLILYGYVLFNNKMKNDKRCNFLSKLKNKFERYGVINFCFWFLSFKN